MTCVICEKRVNVKKHHSYTVLGNRKVGACGEHIKAFSDWIDQQVSKCPDCCDNDSCCPGHQGAHQ